MSGLPERIGRMIRPVGTLFRGERQIEALAALALLGGALLVLADFVTLFEIKARTAVREQTGGDHHGYSIAVLGGVMILSTLLARAGESWAPAAATAVLALAVLAITLIGDLPDATRSDLIAGGQLGEANPTGGFWLQLIGAVLALVGSVLLARVLARRGAAARRSRRRRYQR
jgi:hypothetical protein